MIGRQHRYDSISRIHKSITKLLRIEVRVLIFKQVIQRVASGKRHTETWVLRRASGRLLTIDDAMMAIEELLCDEEAMEFCFEGTRWYDLMRFARHKNRAGLQGNQWLADKVKANEPKTDLTNEQNWYLPFSSKK